jgi:hypothetical protein
MPSPFRPLGDDDEPVDRDAPPPTAPEQPEEKLDTEPEDDGRGEWAGFDTFEAGDADTASLLAVGPLDLPDDLEE